MISIVLLASEAMRKLNSFNVFIRVHHSMHVVIRTCA